MPQILLRKIFTVFAVLLFFGPSAFAQLPAFALTVTATNESCTANGALNFTVSNTAAGTTVVYRIYQLPNTTTPIATTSANTFTGLTAGNYRVIATQSLGNESNQQQQDGVILSVIVPFNYTLSGQRVVCGNDGKITVNAFSGTPVSYEIFSGPVTRPLQASNVFNSLPGIHSGTYTVKVVSGGCESAESSVVVSVGELPEVTLAAACENNRYILRATVLKAALDQAASDFSWTGPNQFSGNGNPVEITRGTPGIYTVTVTTAEGCTASAQAEITNTFCSIPPGISPNGDTKNDLLDLSGMGILKFKIYNRYGRMIFEQDNYSNQWHGQDFNGNELPDATYYYYIRLDSGTEKTGWVYVTR